MITPRVKSQVRRALVLASTHGEAVALRHNWLQRPPAPELAAPDPEPEPVVAPEPAPTPPAPPAPPAPPVLDFSSMLHVLRGTELQRMPRPQLALLSAGCSDRFYFDWVTANVGPIARHIGIELYLPEPPVLPEGVEWVKNSVGDMSSVDDGSVDVVFSGQNFEHLFDDDAVTFLTECHRVLTPGGHVVIDSPNRDVVHRLLWTHPEHTIEFTPSEAVELVTLAGFDVSSVRGVWHCADPVTGADLDLWPWAPDEHPDQSLLTSRAVLAADDPDHSFVWWLEAVRADRAPDVEALRALHAAIVEDASGPRMARLHHHVGKVEDADGGRVVSARAGEAGALMFGPYVPLVPGTYRARFRLRRQSEGEGEVAVVDAADATGTVLGGRTLTAADLPLGEWTTVEIGFTVPALVWGGQYRVVTTGAFALDARFETDVDVTPTP